MSNTKMVYQVVVFIGGRQVTTMATSVYETKSGAEEGIMHYVTHSKSFNEAKARDSRLCIGYMPVMFNKGCMDRMDLDSVHYVWPTDKE